MESSVFCTGRKPITFTVLPQPGKRPIELMIRVSRIYIQESDCQENGGSIVPLRTENAIFVVVPVSNAPLPEDVHLGANLVYADWVWDSVRSQKLLAYEQYGAPRPPA